MENTFYHGDCLFVLTHDIAPESVDLIYLDPPFFTGKIQKGTKKWHPGAMEVSFDDSKRFWKEKGISVQAPEWMKHVGTGRSEFASYLYYMMERLQACHKVLKKAGSIYLHCDYRASHYLKMVMDEIFGVSNFRNEIIWCYAGGGIPNKDYPRKHDTIFRYVKDAKEYKKGGTFNIEYRPFGGWIAEFKLHKPRRRKLDMGKGTPINDWWIDLQHLTSYQRNEWLGYPTQKPETLLERIIKASSNEGDIVLDPFGGCGTTAIVASKLNRRFIGIDIHPTSFEVIKNRSHELFAQSRYVSRTLDEVLGLAPDPFQVWVNEFYAAYRPKPDKGVDGIITSSGIPIQSKTGTVDYRIVSQFLTDAKYHPWVKQPLSRIIIVSQSGFDDGARQRKFEIEAKEDIDVELQAPRELLNIF